jgi:hypothetical protein
MLTAAAGLHTARTGSGWKELGWVKKVKEEPNQLTSIYLSNPKI